MRRGSLTRAGAWVAGGTALSYAVALVARIAMGSWFGDGPAVDLYFLLYGLAEWLPLLAALTLERTLLPRLHRLHEERGEAAANCTAGVHLLAASILLLGSIVASVFFAGPLVESLPLPPLRADPITGVDLVAWLLPAAFLPVLTAVLRAFLFSRGHFVHPTAASLAGRIVHLSSLLVLAPIFGIEALGAAVLFANGVNAGLLLVLAFRGGLRPAWGWVTQMPAAMRRSASGIGLVGTTALVGRSDMIVDRLFCSFLPSGSLTCLAFAASLVRPARAILESATAMTFAEIARLLAAGRRGAAAELVDRQMRIFLAIGVPVVAASCLLGPLLVADIFGRGAFGPPAVSRTSRILAAYSGVFVFGLCSRTFAMVLYAAELHRLLLLLAVLVGGCNALLDFVLLPFGATGIALATTGVACAGALAAAPFVKRELGPLPWRSWLGTSILSAFLGIISSGTARLAGEWLAGAGVSGLPRAALLTVLFAGLHAALALGAKQEEARFIASRLWIRLQVPAISGSQEK